MSNTVFEALRLVTGKPVPTEFKGVKFFSKPVKQTTDPIEYAKVIKKEQDERAAKVQEVLESAKETPEITENIVKWSLIMNDMVAAIIERAVQEDGTPVFESEEDVRAVANDPDDLTALWHAVIAPKIAGAEDAIKK